MPGGRAMIKLIKKLQLWLSLVINLRTVFWKRNVYKDVAYPAFSIYRRRDGKEVCALVHHLEIIAISKWEEVQGILIPQEPIWLVCTGEHTYELSLKSCREIKELEGFFLLDFEADNVATFSNEEEFIAYNYKIRKILLQAKGKYHKIDGQRGIEYGILETYDHYKKMIFKHPMANEPYWELSKIKLEKFPLITDSPRFNGNKVIRIYHDQVKIERDYVHLEHFSKSPIYEYIAETVDGRKVLVGIVKDEICELPLKGELSPIKIKQNTDYFMLKDGENIKICKFGDRCLTTQKEYHARKILFEEGYFDFQKGIFIIPLSLMTKVSAGSDEAELES